LGGGVWGQSWFLWIREFLGDRAGFIWVRDSLGDRAGLMVKKSLGTEYVFLML